MFDASSFLGVLLPRRWAKLRFAMVPHTIVLEPLSECMILGIMAAWSLNFLLQVDPFAVYLFHLLLWFLLDYVLLSVVQVRQATYHSHLRLLMLTCFLSSCAEWSAAIQ